MSETPEAPDETWQASSAGEAFVFLLARYERHLATYAMTLVPQAADAEDILQEAKVVMWRNFASFEQGTNFGAWARRVVFNQILTHRKKRQRDRLQFSDAFLESVAAEVDRSAEVLEARQKQLDECVARLQAEHGEIVTLRYREGLSIEAISERTRRTVAALYRLLSRLRVTLHACVSQNTAAEGSHGTS